MSVPRVIVQIFGLNIKEFNSLAYAMPQTISDVLSSINTSAAVVLIVSESTTWKQECGVGPKLCRWFHFFECGQRKI